MTEPKSQALLGEPLYLDVVAALKGQQIRRRYRSSPDVMVLVLKIQHRLRSLLYMTIQKKQKFTIGIVDDVTQSFP